MSKKSSNSRNAKNSQPEFEPVTDYPQIPFALAEIVAETQDKMPHVARLADSMLDLLLGFPALTLLALPEESKAGLREALSIVWRPAEADAPDQTRAVEIAM